MRTACKRHREIQEMGNDFHEAVRAVSRHVRARVYTKEEILLELHQELTIRHVVDYEETLVFSIAEALSVTAGRGLLGQLQLLRRPFVVAMLLVDVLRNSEGGKAFKRPRGREGRGSKEITTSIVGYRQHQEVLQKIVAIVEGQEQALYRHALRLGAPLPPNAGCAEESVPSPVLFKVWLSFEPSTRAVIAYAGTLMLGAVPHRVAYQVRETLEHLEHYHQVLWAHGVIERDGNILIPTLEITLD